MPASGEKRAHPLASNAPISIAAIGAAPMQRTSGAFPCRNWPISPIPSLRGPELRLRADRVSSVLAMWVGFFFFPLRCSLALLRRAHPAIDVAPWQRFHGPIALGSREHRAVPRRRNTRVRIGRITCQCRRDRDRHQQQLTEYSRAHVPEPVPCGCAAERALWRCLTLGSLNATSATQPPGPCVRTAPAVADAKRRSRLEAGAQVQKGLAVLHRRTVRPSLSRPLAPGESVPSQPTS